MQIIIPAAKLVPEELQNLGKLPAIVYPVNQRIVFDYLYERYSGASFKVIVYEKAETVKRQLEKYSDTEVITLPVLKDLGYSIQTGIQGLSGEIIINFGDTIIFNEGTNLGPDSFYYSEEEMSSMWTFFEETDGVITNIIDKKEGSGGVGKLFCGVFRISNSKLFYDCLQEAQSIKNINSFYAAIMRYSRLRPLSPVKANNWLDIGHLEKYYASQLEVKAREFNHIQIDKNRGILTKTSDDIDKFIGEIKWYLKLPADVEYVRPRIFDYSTSYEHPYVSMEYYTYHTIHELFLYGDLSKVQWIDIFRRIRFAIEDLKRYRVKDERITQSLEEMYLSKTVDRLKQLEKHEHFKSFFSNTITVNGNEYKNLNDIIDILKIEIPNRLYSVDEFNIIHGDLCFANILIDNNFNFIKMIDPRGKFGSFDIYGDSRYELAKLFHSIHGKYDFIIKDLFSVTFDEANIQYSINDKSRDYDLFDVFLQVFDQEIKGKRTEIELIEAILFLSMIPLHGESIKHQMVMLGTGLDILNRVTKITVE